MTDKPHLVLVSKTAKKCASCGYAEPTLYTADGFPVCDCCHDDMCDQREEGDNE